MRRIFTIGEVVYDIIFKHEQPEKATPGGSMLNTAVTLGRTGIPVFFIGETGSDKISDIITSFLNKNGVSTGHVVSYQNRNTTIALAFLDANNDASYVFHKDYPQNRLTGELPRLCKNDIVLFGSSFALTPSVRTSLVSFLKNAKDLGATTIYDPNFRKQRSDISTLMPMIEENISLSSIVRGSDEDFSNIFGTSNISEIHKIATKYGCDNLVVTRNKYSVEVRTKNISLSYPVKPIHPVSTIGAGDNFNAGLIYGLTKHDIEQEDIDSIDERTWEKLVGLGVEFSSHVCMSMDNYVDESFAAHFSSQPTS